MTSPVAAAPAAAEPAATPAAAATEPAVAAQEPAPTADAQPAGEESQAAAVPPCLSCVIWGLPVVCRTALVGRAALARLAMGHLRVNARVRARAWHHVLLARERARETEALTTTCAAAPVRLRQ